MKRLLTMVLVLSLASAVFAGGGSESESADGGQKQIVLKYGHQNAVDHLVHIYSVKWADDVAAKTNGRIKIEVYPANQLGNLREMMESVELGTLDITLGDTSMMSTVLPEFGLLALPFIFQGYDHAEKVIDGDVGRMLNEKLAATNNMRPLGWFWNGFRNFATKTPITTVADCKGIKMRSPEAKIYMDTFKTLGMNPTPVPWGDVYTALSSGVVDAMESVPEAIYKQDFYKLAKYITDSKHIFSVVGPTISESVWQSLSPADQKILADSLKTIVAQQRAESIALEKSFYDGMKAGGAVITKFENQQEVIDLFTPYWSEYAEDSDSVDSLKAILALRK
jgi:tripartite ATP-independent transporter DctP family solute receptor